MALHAEVTLYGVMVMFNSVWGGFPYPSLLECLVVFAVVFLAGVLWSWGLRMYVARRLREGANA
jgi:high-affinity Fe2+/Pb2+ permease